MEFKTERLDHYVQNVLPGFEALVPPLVGEQILAQIEVGWSAESPSTPGTAPAIVSGELAGSVRMEVSTAGVRVGTDTAHGAMLEYGTSKLPARPWLRPAVERVRDEIVTIVRELFAA